MQPASAAQQVRRMSIECLENLSENIIVIYLSRRRLLGELRQWVRSVLHLHRKETLFLADNKILAPL